MGTGFWYGRWFPVLLPAQRCATLARADGIIFVADAQRALWSSCDRGTFHTVRGRPNALAEDDAVSLLDFERVAAAAETALREKLALEVKARPQVPPAALFKPTVKKKRRSRSRAAIDMSTRRLTSTAVREQLAIPQDAFVLDDHRDDLPPQAPEVGALRAAVPRAEEDRCVLPVGRRALRQGRSRGPGVRRRVLEQCAEIRPAEPGAPRTVWRFCGAISHGGRFTHRRRRPWKHIRSIRWKL